MAVETDSPQRIARLTPLPDALARLDALVAPVTSRTAAISSRLGYRLAEDVVIAAPIPPTACALRDGWAVRSDLTIDASGYAPAPLPFAMRIDVGDPLPGEADAVAPLDVVVTRDGAAEALAPVGPGEGVLPVAAEAAAGATLLASGRALGVGGEGVGNGWGGRGTGIAGAARCGARGLAPVGPQHAGAARRKPGDAGRANGMAHAQSVLPSGIFGTRPGAMRGRLGEPHSLGLRAARGARAGQRMGFHPGRERRTSGAVRGRGKTFAMTAPFQPKSTGRDPDVFAALRRAARQEQFLEVVSAEEARARFLRAIDLAPLPGETVALAEALGRVLAADVTAPIDVPPFDRAT